MLFLIGSLPPRESPLLSPSTPCTPHFRNRELSPFPGPPLSCLYAHLFVFLFSAHPHAETASPPLGRGDCHLPPPDTLPDTAASHLRPALGPARLRSHSFPPRLGYNSHHVTRFSRSRLHSLPPKRNALWKSRFYFNVRHQERHFSQR